MPTETVISAPSRAPWSIGHPSVVRPLDPVEPVEVFDPGSPGVDVSLLRLLAARPHRGRAIVFGTPADAALVHAEGFEIVARIRPPHPMPRTWSGPLRRTLAAIGHAGIVRTWSESTLVAALGAVEEEDRIDAAICAVAARSPWIEPWRRQRVAVRAMGEDLGPRLFRRGWRLGTLRRLAQVPSPPLSCEPPSRQRAGREGLVVAVVGSPADAIDGRLALTAAAATAVAGREVTVVFSPNHPGWMEAGRWACGLVAASASARLRVVVDARVEDPRRAAADVDLAVMPVRRTRLGDVSLPTARAWLAAGIPVMAPATRGLAALVDDGVDGRLLPPDDRNALSRALLRVADDPALLEDMSHAAAARHGARRPTAIGRGGRAHDEGSNAANASAAWR